jgi:hypothetical protein
VESFESILLDTIDETLSLVLSERAKEAIYSHVEKYYDLRKEEIPIKPEVFASCLEKIFGRAAAVMEKMVLKRFYSKLGIAFEETKDWNFKDYIISAERSAKAFSRSSLFEVGRASR